MAGLELLIVLLAMGAAVYFVVKQMKKDGEIK